MSSARMASLVAAALTASCGEGIPQQGGALDRGSSARLTQDEVLPTGATCTPTGAHGKHAGYDCKVCHLCGGVLAFDPLGPAVSPGLAAPAFDAAAKTCSNVACHGMYAGTFSFYFPGGDGEPELITVAYEGNGGSTPSWYSSGAGCTACHGNPPANAPVFGAYTWHSGHHGNQLPTGTMNQCQLCHPDATGSGGFGTAITDRTRHANGSVDVAGKFTNACFGCH